MLYLAGQVHNRDDAELPLIVQHNDALAEVVSVDIVVDRTNGQRYVRICAGTAPFTADDLVTVDEFEDEVDLAITTGRVARDDGTRIPLSKVEARYAAESYGLERTDRRRNELEEDWLP
jgi:hypothetical protein